MWKYSVIVLLVAAVGYKYYQLPYIEDSPIVKTENGLVKGKVSISRDGKQFFEYLGIPYAKPPVEKLRYEGPLKLENWDGVRLAQKHGAECAQVDFVAGIRLGEESCLFLNVATPNIADNSKIPVIVFIHGGLFVSGSSNPYGPHYLIDEDVIVVTINYRLASLGFLNTGDGVVRGNMGLKDQLLALKWVHSNIENFGGDKKKVTIVGNSAGAASVHYHLLSPLSKGLFYRAISQSGTVLNSWTLRKNPVAQAKRYATRLHCPTSNSKEMLACLQKLPIDTILDSHDETRDMFRDLDGLFVPTVETIKDGAMIPDHPYNLIRAGPANHVPWMTGYNTDEGQIFIALVGKNESSMSLMDENPRKQLHNLMMYENGDEAHRNDLVDKMVKFYFKNTQPSGFNTIAEYNNMFTDGIFAYGISEAMKFHAEVQPVYPYYFAYIGEAQIANLMMAMKGKYHPVIEALYYVAESWVNRNIFGREPLLKGTAHADELLMLFQLEPFASIKPGDKDYDMSKKMVKLWAAFAKGEKTINCDGKPLTKLEPNANVVQYLKLDTVVDLIPEPNVQRLKFWKDNYLLE